VGVCRVCRCVPGWGMVSWDVVLSLVHWVYGSGLAGWLELPEMLEVVGAVVGREVLEKSHGANVEEILAVAEFGFAESADFDFDSEPVPGVLPLETMVDSTDNSISLVEGDAADAFAADAFAASVAEKVVGTADIPVEEEAAAAFAADTVHGAGEHCWGIGTAASWIDSEHIAAFAAIAFVAVIAAAPFAADTVHGSGEHCWGIGTAAS